MDDKQINFESDNRPSWDEVYSEMAQVVASRSTCSRAYVGAVITKNNAILATGYNGAISGEDHCLTHGHILDDNDHCIRTVHAEINALMQCAKIGQAVEGATMYCTFFPCLSCVKAIIQAGIKTIKFISEYKMNTKETQYALHLLKLANIDVYILEGKGVAKKYVYNQ